MHVGNEISVAYFPIRLDSNGEKIPGNIDNFIFDNYEEAFDCLCNIIQSKDRKLAFVDVERTIYFYEKNDVSNYNNGEIL